MDGLVDCLDQGEAFPDRLALQHQALVMRRFRRALEDHPDRAIHIPELCAAIGVSDRTLRACCQEPLGMGPRRYLALRRLHLARRALCDAQPGETTVAAVAARYGFFEFGRFAGRYRGLFAEPPSATLARKPA